MKALRHPSSAPAGERGAALLLSFMVLLVLILILAQIKYSTDTAARVARNEETMLSMNLSIESALLQVYEDLKTDAESAGTAGGAAGALGGAAGGGEGGGGGGEEEGPTDSKEDAWSRPQRTEINQIQLRVLIQDEDSKFNVLSVLTEDEQEAEKALDRLARVIEWSRKGTQAEIDGSTARRMAEAIKEFMVRRNEQTLPRPKLLSDAEEDDDRGLPLSLREFVVIDPELFSDDLFRDFIDEDGRVVHSLGSFLTVWSNVSTLEDARAQPPGGGGDEGGEEEGQAGEEGQGGQANQEGGNGEEGGNGQEGGGQAGENQAGEGQGQEQAGGGGGSSSPGWAINLNTAPPAVLSSLFESRDLPYRFWDDVIAYRNEKDDAVEENEDPPLDEYGRPIIVHKFFHTVQDLSQVDGWENLEPIVQGELIGLLKTESQVFSITITARKPTGDEQIGDRTTRQEDVEREEAEWHGLVRTVRTIVWRRVLGEGEVDIVPLVRWEVLDNVPFPVLDFPESRDFR